MDVSKIDVLLMYRDIKLLTSIAKFATAAFVTSPVINPPSAEQQAPSQFAIVLMDVQPEKSEEEDEEVHVPPLELPKDEGKMEKEQETKVLEPSHILPPMTQTQTVIFFFLSCR